MIMLFQKEGFSWRPFTLHIEKNDETLKVELRWPTDIAQYMVIGQLSIFYTLQEGSK